MEYHVVSMDSGATYAPDGTEFNNMQILGCVEAGNVIEARKKFMEENKDMMSHGYEDKFPLRFYVVDDALDPLDDDIFFAYSLKENEMTFLGLTVGSLRVPLDDETKKFLEENDVPEGEIIELYEDDVRELYHKVVSKLMASI